MHSSGMDYCLVSETEIQKNADINQHRDACVQCVIARGGLSMGMSQACIQRLDRVGVNSGITGGRLECTIAGKNTKGLLG